MTGVRMASFFSGFLASPDECHSDGTWTDIDAMFVPHGRLRSRHLPRLVSCSSTRQAFAAVGRNLRLRSPVLHLQPPSSQYAKTK